MAEHSELEQLKAEVERLRGEQRTVRQQAFKEFLEMRGIEKPCPKCEGMGVRAYPSTSTWRGGIGGSMITSDVCNGCWGTGDADRKGVDLRKLAGMEAALAAERAAHASTAQERDAFARFLWNRLTAHDSDERAKKMIEVHAKMYPMWGRFLAVLASMRAQPQEQQQ